MLATFLTFTYLLWTFFTASLVLVALVPLPKYVTPQQRFAVMIIGTLVTEGPHVMLLIKFLALAWFKFYVGIFTSPATLAAAASMAAAALNSTETVVADAATSTTSATATAAAILASAASKLEMDETQRSLWSQWIYMLDVGVFLAYWAILLQLYYAKMVVDTATAVYRNAESTEAPGVTT
jgi:hypothetical protein